ncbi:tRNA (adenosine(37)-N6)-threonylcarbamoyltransferase complex dimerization subunit type 1 TsaB [Paucilactobacillus wasatchensis]|uniref:Putative molecular chaperone n=1 Tax=Paucilactobacillus wasatchensis TaxID=1335616 RepID=A0A0D1A952_9LACO|nr:tRNA (adenosine(37)-N6)-threonylcarbamoyltransferase complex dimerization subunit type 1 TsaB [Paucilactobacillus wasatchensis]KIS03276.1 putative molecular chaperone [Paucilactobacillus wasatchensis]
MKILAMDTSNHPLSVALVEDWQLVAETTLNLAKNHSVYLMPTIESLMKSVDWQPEQLDRVVVAHGPGSYTGVRIAVTTAKTLATTLDIELVGISSLKLIAANVTTFAPEQLIVSFFDARRGNVFAGGYQWVSGKLVTSIPEKHVAFNSMLNALPSENRSTILVGELNDGLEEQLKNVTATQFKMAPENTTIPSAYQLALLSKQETPVKDIDGFVPNYLRMTEAEVEWQKLHPGESKQSYVREV